MKMMLYVPWKNYTYTYSYAVIINVHYLTQILLLFFKLNKSVKERVGIPSSPLTPKSST